MESTLIFLTNAKICRSMKPNEKQNTITKGCIALQKNFCQHEERHDNGLNHTTKIEKPNKH